MKIATPKLSGSFLKLLLCCAIFASTVEAIDESESSRAGKVLPVFQVVRFPNDVCAATSRNGTCYTAEECSTRGGKNGGSCASGFGVCCLFELSCGGTTNDNVSYLVQSSTPSVTPCKYTVCPCNNNICRIRYDFTSFVIGAQNAGTAAATAAALVAPDYFGACLIDTFTIHVPGAAGPPIICGTNTGYHMITDVVNNECQTPNFGIGPSTSTTRQWDIKITQYACGDENGGGPAGCLQYFTDTFGVVASFGFSDTAVLAATTHLQNQFYETCYRRAKGYCYLCFSPSLTAAIPAAITGNSFGLSVSADAAIAQASVGTTCATDYLVIPGAATSTNAAKTSLDYATFSRVCGRIFNIIAGNIATATICTRQSPFRLGVNIDHDEATTSIVGTTNEQDTFPGGIVGFKLDFFQVTC